MPICADRAIEVRFGEAGRVRLCYSRGSDTYRHAKAAFTIAGLVLRVALAAESVARGPSTWALVDTGGPGCDTGGPAATLAHAAASAGTDTHREAHPMPVTGLSPRVLARIVAAVAEERGLAVADVTITEIVAMRWADASLGCPEPGMLYAQVITDGFQIVIDAAGHRHDYRVTRSGGFRRCDRGDGDRSTDDRSR